MALTLGYFQGRRQESWNQGSTGRTNLLGDFEQIPASFGPHSPHWPHNSESPLCPLPHPEGFPVSTLNLPVFMRCVLPADPHLPVTLCLTWSSVPLKLSIELSLIAVLAGLGFGEGCPKHPLLDLMVTLQGLGEGGIRGTNACPGSQRSSELTPRSRGLQDFYYFLTCFCFYLFFVVVF